MRKRRNIGGNTGISRVIIFPWIESESIVAEEVGAGGFEGEIEVGRSVTVKLGREFRCGSERCRSPISRGGVLREGNRGRQGGEA